MRPEALPNRTGDFKEMLGESQLDAGGIYDGTVGWQDGSEHFETADEGMDLVKVTLFFGAAPDTEGPNTNPERARGHQIRIRIDPTTDALPDDGDHVIVAIPANRWRIPGAGALLKVTRRAPKWIPNRKSGEKILFGTKDSFVRFKENGSIHVFTRDAEGADGKSVSFQVRRDGFVFQHPHMKITAGPNGYHAVHSSGARIDFGSIGGLAAPLNALSSWLKLSAALVKIEASGVEIGANGAVVDNLAKSTPLLALLGEISSALDLLFAYVGAVATAAQPAASPPTNVGTLAPVIAAAGLAGAAVGTFAASSAAAPTVLPTQSTTVA